jgi:DNA-binding transcriptional regulator/RsmH inhibitor MraZ
MDKIIKFLKSFGLSDQEIKKVLKEVPVDQSGLAGTNVAKGIFEKGGKEASADYPLITETMVSPFKIDKYKGLSRKETLEKADEALNFLDKELTRTSNLILNQNLQLSPEQKINFANNLRMKKQFEKDLEIFKTVPEAEVIKFETKKPVSKEGIEQLTKESGQINPPGTLAGDIETRVNRLKAIGEKKGMNLGEILKETGEAQLKYAAGDDVGLVRSVARQIMFNDIKSGKLKAPKEIQDIVSGASNIDVIEPFRTIYGENALEQLDSLIPDIKNFANEVDAEKFVRSKYEFTPKLDRPKESYTKEEMKKILEKEPVKKPTKEDYEDYAEILNDSENFVVQGNETFEELDALVKKQKDYEDFMYMQYKRGKLDPVAGEKTQDRMKFLQKKLEEAEMLKDRRLISPNELKELEDLEKTFSPIGTSNKINISDPKVAKDLTDFAKQNDPEGFKKIQKIVDDINNKNTLEDFDIKDREPNARGGRIGYAEGTSSRGLDYLTGQEPSEGYAENAPSITLDTHEKASGNMDKYPIKAGNLELGISGLMTGGKSYQANPYNKITGSERNVSVRGKYNIPDTGVSIAGDIGDVRMRTNQNINVPQYNIKETIKDVIRDRPYSVGVEYAPNENRNINLRYDNQGNVTLRGEARFAKGGLSYLMGF